MAISKRVLGIVLSVVMAFTMIPMGLVGTAAAESKLTPVKSTSDTGNGALVVPKVTLESTDVIRIASAVGAITPGNTIVAATPSGLPQISGNYSAQYYCNETPTSPVIVLASDRELSATPTIACENNTNVTFSSAVVGRDNDNNVTYTWTVTAGTNVTIGALKFVVGYNYVYTDVLTGKSISKTYQAFATSYVENIAQPGGIAVYRERSAKWTTHEREQCHYVARILGSNTYGSYYDETSTSNSSNFNHGYFDFTAENSRRSWVNLGASSAAKGYGLVIYDTGTSGGSSDAGNVTSNTGIDYNRPVSTTYVDRGMGESLTNSNLRLTMFEANQGRSDYTFWARYSSMKVLAGDVAYAADSADNNTSRTQIGFESISTDTQLSASGFSELKFTGTTYGDVATDLDNGNKQSTYTLVTVYGTIHTNASDRSNNVSSAIDMHIESYDKSELRGYIDELLSENDPTTPYASGSKIGLYPQESFYSAGWPEFKQAFQAAQAILNQPNTNQNEINAAHAALETAVGGLVVKEADYSVINTATEEFSKLNVLNYTTESWSRVQDALKQINQGYSVFYQCAVDKWAEGLNNAISLLEYADADYTKVEEILETYEQLDPTKYTAESWAELRNAVDSIEYGKKVPEQGIVDAYAAAVAAKINELVPALADYTQLNIQRARYEQLLPSSSLYSDQLWRIATVAYNSCEMDLTWKFQQDVDDYTESLTTALNNLKYKDADYSAVDTAIEAADNINVSWYTPKSYAAVTSAVDAVVRGYDITRQTEVDKMAAAINNAIAALIDADGDYSKVEAANNAVDALDTSIYTTDSLQAVYDAQDNVVYDLLARDQERIDGFATAINTAVKNLIKLPADYSAVESIKTEWNNFPNKSNYTNASIIGVSDAINAVNYDLDITQQETVDGYVTAIRDAINNLILKPADYSSVDTALTSAQQYINTQTVFASKYNNYSYYTSDSYSALTTAMAAVVRDYDITKQADVNKMATDITNAISGLKENSAYYAELDRVLATIPTDIESGNYTDTSLASYLVAKNAIDRTLLTSSQSDVDQMVADLSTAIEGLKYKDASYKAVDDALAKVPSEQELSKYTKDTVAALTTAVQAVVRGYDITRQSDVDKMAADIETAIQGLKLDFADYTLVDSAILSANAKIADKNYTEESIANVQSKIDAVVRGLASSEQARVNQMATDIDYAVSCLTFKPLDTSAYTAIVIPEDFSDYTTDTALAVTNKKSDIDGYILNHNITNQVEFDSMVAEFDAVVKSLKYKDFDYSQLDAQRDIVKNLDESMYLTDSWQSVQDTINSSNSYYNNGEYLTQETFNNGCTYKENQELINNSASAIANAVANLEMKPADYSLVDQAIGNIPTDLSVYTDETRLAVESVLSTVDRTLKIDKQANVDEYANSINRAVDLLKYKPADYSALLELKSKAENLVEDNYTNYDDIYWSYIYEYTNSTIPDNMNYNITEQASVDAMTSTLQGYIDMLEIKPADYTAVNEKVAIAQEKVDSKFYTDDSSTELQSVIDSINYNLDILHQTEVDAYVTALDNAIGKLIDLPSDFSKIDELYNSYVGKDDDYTNYIDVFYGEAYPYYTEDIDSVRNVYTTKSQQSEVDKMYKNLFDIFAKLESGAESVFVPKDGSTTVFASKNGVQCIYGLKDKLTKSKFTSEYVTMENVELEYIAPVSSRYLGTGTVINVKSTITNEIIATYTIVIFGDINGDGQITLKDVTSIKKSLSGGEGLSGAYKTAANINGDRYTNSKDSIDLGRVVGGSTTINQATGKIN